MKYYTGVGSRSTPPEVLGTMKRLAFHLASSEWILRSGGADGADMAFQEGAEDANALMDIYVPWKGFGRQNWGYTPLEYADPVVRARAEYVVRCVHPAPDHLSAAALKLHTRNVFQVLGYDLKTPSRFVVC